ncbi:MAG: tryptophan 2,3-dioxygenase family protein [Flavobacteriales bacterium]
MYYSEYLQLDKVLTAQQPESDKLGRPAHDEMLFIIIHQTYELWFKQILFEVQSVQTMLSGEIIDDNGPELHKISMRLNRVVEILKVLVHQIDVMETMTALDFLDFRDMLRPASGFQSVQFKELEARLGLKMEQRHGKDYYTSQLTANDKTYIESVPVKQSVLELCAAWLSRMPFIDELEKISFWNQYESQYSASLSDGEITNMHAFRDLFMEEKDGGSSRLNMQQRRAALFIMLYRDLPIMQNPFRLLNLLLEIDEFLANWRWRHMNMVHRMIGLRAGTGGSSGKGYLREAAMRHYIFSEIAELSSFMIERSKLPELPDSLMVKASYAR